MTPEEEQKLRNFRLLGGGSSMELPQQQQPTAPLLGQGQVSPNILSQVPGIENVSLAPTANAAAAMRPEATGDIDPSRLSVTPEAPEAPSGYNPFGIGTSIGLGGPLEEIIMNPETWQPYGQRATQRATPDAPDAGSTQSQPSIPSGEAGSPQANFANFMQGGGQLSQEQIAQANAFAESMGTTFDPETGYDRQPFLDSQQAGGAATAAPTSNYDPMGVTPQAQKAAAQAAGEMGVQGMSPVPNFLRDQNVVSADMSANAPMGVEATQARIGELLGLDGPATLNQAMTGQPDAVMGTDAQGRMRSFESPEARTQNLADAQQSFEQASADLQARIAERDRRPGESKTQRDTRIADSGKQGGASERDAAGLTQGDRRNILREQGIGGSAQVDAARQMGVENNRKIENERLQNERLEQIIAKGNQPDATKFQKQRAEFEERMQALQEQDNLEDWEVNAMRNDFLGRPAPQGYKSWAEYESLKRGDEAPTETPAASTDIPTINTPEEYEKLPKGAQYRDSEGKLATKR